MEGSIEARPPEQAAARPLLVTVLCVLGFIGVPAAVWLAFSDTARDIAPWYPTLLIVSSLIGAVCLVGIWMMRKWGVYAYAAFAALNQIVLIATELWSPMSLIYRAIFVAVAAAYLPRMH